MRSTRTCARPVHAAVAALQRRGRGTGRADRWPAPPPRSAGTTGSEQARAAEALRFAPPSGPWRANAGRRCAQFAALAADGKTGFAELARLSKPRPSWHRRTSPAPWPHSGAWPATRRRSAPARPRAAAGGRAAAWHGDPASSRAGWSRWRRPGRPGATRRGNCWHCWRSGPARSTRRGTADRAEQGGRRAAVAAAPGRGAAAGDWGRSRRPLMRAARRRRCSPGRSRLVAGCGEGTWLGENAAPPLPGERKSVLLIEDRRGRSASPELNVTLPPPRATPPGRRWRLRTHEACSTWPPRRPSPWPGAPPSAPVPAAARSPVGRPVVAAGRRLRGRRRRHDDGAGRGRRQAVVGVLCRGSREQVDRLAGGARPSRRQACSWPAATARLRPRRRLREGGLARPDPGADPRGADASPRARCWSRRPTTSSTPSMRRTGEVLWQHAGLFEQAGLLGGASPAVLGLDRDRRLRLGRGGGAVIGQRPAALERDRCCGRGARWRSAAIADIIGDPVIADDRVFVAGASGEMAAFDLQRGDREWTADVTSTQTPWVAGNFLFILTERSELVCMLHQGGRIRWVSPLPTLVDPAETGIRARSAGPVRCWSASRLLLASSEGDIISVSPLTGEILGTRRRSAERCRCRPRWPTGRCSS